MYGDSHDKDKTVVRPSYPYNGNSCIGKGVYLYQNDPGGSVEIASQSARLLAEVSIFNMHYIYTTAIQNVLLVGFI